MEAPAQYSRQIICRSIATTLHIIFGESTRAHCTVLHMHGQYMQTSFSELNMCNMYRKGCNSETEKGKACFTSNITYQAQCHNLTVIGTNIFTFCLRFVYSICNCFSDTYHCKVSLDFQSQTGMKSMANAKFFACVESAAILSSTFADTIIV